MGFYTYNDIIGCKYFNGGSGKADCNKIEG